MPAVYAHTGSVRGAVTDVTTHKPIEGANVFIEGEKLTVVTDGFGSFFIKGIKEGVYTIQISHLGFETAEQQLKIEDGVTTNISIELLPTAIQMKDVSVSSGKKLNLNTVSGLDLQSRPVNSTQDLMRLVPGLFTAQHQGGGKAEQIFLRGFDADHGTDVNVTVDDMPVNMVSHAHGQGFADAHFIIPELVQEVDFGKGPYEINKGDFATAGWVAFKTKNYLENNFIKTDVGSYNYFRLVGGVNLFEQNNSRKEGYIAGEYGYNRGYFDMPQNFNKVNIVGKFTHHIADNKTLSVTLSGFHTSWDASGQVPMRAISQGIIGRYGGLDPEGGITSRYNANIQYTQSINANTVLKSNVYSAYYTFSLYSDFTYFLVDTTYGDQIHQAESRYLTGNSNEVSTAYFVKDVKMRTDVGVGFRYDNIIDDELSHIINRSTVLNNIALGDISQTNVYGYVNQSVYLSPRFVLTAGTRYDHFFHSYTNKLRETQVNTTYDVGALSPKIGAHYNVTDNMRIYMNYGVGFHSNDTRTVALAPTGENSIAYVLPLAHSTDIGIVIKPTNNLLVAVALWQLNLQEEFAYVGDESQVEPSGRTERKGIDLSIRYQPLSRWYIDCDINYANAIYTDEPQGENYVPLTAPLTSIGGMNFKINKHFTTGLRYRYMADRSANEDKSIVAPGYTVFDAIVCYSRPKYEIGMQVLNLFNTQWNEAAFATETRLRNEIDPVTELCVTPGTPIFLKLHYTYKF